MNREFKSILVSAPKRSGGTLLNRLFDHQPGVVDFCDEAYFWEHVYNYLELGKLETFLDIFKKYSVEDIEKSLIDRDLLPWIEGIYKQYGPQNFELDLKWNRTNFLKGLTQLKNSKSIKELWQGLVSAYANAIDGDYKNADSVFCFSGDYGRSMLAAQECLSNYKGIFIIRNPFYALESLKRARSISGRMELTSFTMAQSLNYYNFFWKNLDKIKSSNTIVIKFEDVIMNPEVTMKEVADHVDIEFTKNLITPTLRGQLWNGDSSFHKLDGIDKKTVLRPLKDLSSSDIDFINHNLKGILDYFDYKIPNN